jgi:predicted dehydrogenase
MAEKVNVGVIGLGDHSSLSHLKYLAQLGDICEVKVLADLDVQRVQQANELFNFAARTALSAQEVISDDAVDAVMIMTPDRFHAEQLSAAIEEGKHVFCEKPLATSVDEYAQIVASLKRAESDGLIVSTCHPRRFDPPFIALKDCLNNPNSMASYFGVDEDMGDPVSFDFDFQYHKPSKRGIHTSLMFDHLNHEVDLMHFLFGPNQIARAQKHYDSETNFEVSGVRTDGLEFIFSGSRYLDEKFYKEQAHVGFENGTTLSMDMFEGIGVLGLAGEVIRRRDERFKTDYTERFSAINRHFLLSVMGVEPPYISTDEMLINTKAAIDLHERSAYVGETEQSS